MANPKDKTESDPLARWQTVRLTGADILEDMNSLPVDVSKIEFVQATDFDRLAARVKTLEAENFKLRAAIERARDEILGCTGHKDPTVLHELTAIINGQALGGEDDKITYTFEYSSDAGIFFIPKR